MSTMSPFQAWTQALQGMTPTSGASPFEAWTKMVQGGMAPGGASPFDAWTQAMQKMMPTGAMPGAFAGGAASPFQPWIEAMQGGTAPGGWPMTTAQATAAQALYLQLPTEVAARIQKLSAAKVQEQVRLFSEISATEGPFVAMQKQMAFLQQSGLDWSTELMEIMQLYQEKLMSPAQQDAGTAPVSYPQTVA